MLHRKAGAEQHCRGGLQRPASTPATAKQAGMRAPGQPWHGWTVVLRRQPVRMVDGQPQGGYTDVFELICCDCGDNPGLDYRDVSPQLQQVRGPYPIAAGIAAYDKHVRHHQRASHLSQPPTAGRSA